MTVKLLVPVGAFSQPNWGLISIPSHEYLLGIVASSVKLVEVSLKLVLGDEDEDSDELLDDVATELDEELEVEELEDELGALLEEVLGVSVGAGELPPFEPPPQPVNRLLVNNNDKTLVLINFMAITCSRFNRDVCVKVAIRSLPLSSKS